MNPAWPMLVSAALVASLGIGHLLLTARGPKLLPRDPALKDHMQRVHPVITRQTTIWRAWLGFNYSHSLGAILYGVVYGYLAVSHPEVLFRSPLLQVVGGGLLISYLVLARAYWFSTPLFGMALALIAYLASLGLAWL